MKKGLRLQRSSVGVVRGDCGGALIETALAAPLLSLLLLGAVEFGLADYVAIEVANAAKAGVAYGASSPSAAIDNAGIQAAAQNDSANIVTAAGAPSVTATVTRSYVCSVPGATLPNCTPGAIETILTVQTQATFVPLIHIPGFISPIIVHGQATQKVME